MITVTLILSIMRKGSNSVMRFIATESISLSKKKKKKKNESHLYFMFKGVGRSLPIKQKRRK